MRRYRIHPDYVLRQIAGASVIVPLGETGFFANSMMTPNRTAAFLWQAFLEPCTEEEAVMRALEQFDGEETAIRRDVGHFIKETLEKQVLMEVG